MNFSKARNKTSVIVRSLAVLLTLSSCAPSRAPVPAGTIPPPVTTSASDAQAGAEVRAQLIKQFGQYQSAAAQGRVRGIVSQLLRNQSDKANWTITLLDDSSVVNAAATRGNQIFVWRGMLEKVRDNEVLAAVLAHEVAHVRARHVEPTKEEMTNKVLTGLAGAAIGALAANQGAAEETAQVAGSVTSATLAGAIVNPYTQKLELEADTIGLFLMADAGYNPEKALDFWRESASSGSRLTQFFSTHPRSSKRIENIQFHLPAARARYQKSR